MAMNVTEKTGKLVAIKEVDDTNDIMIMTKAGITIRLSVKDLRVLGRVTQGVRLINIDDKDSIASIAKVDYVEEVEEVVEGAEVTDGAEPTGEEPTTDTPEAPPTGEADAPPVE
jgi:DNA gyrase subunit A